MTCDLCFVPAGSAHVKFDVSLFQAFRWWGAGKKLWRKIDEGKNRGGGGEGGFPRSRPSPSSFFSLAFLFPLAAYDLTCSPLSKRLEQASSTFELALISVLADKLN